MGWFVLGRVKGHNLVILEERIKFTPTPQKTKTHTNFPNCGADWDGDIVRMTYN